MNLKVSTKKSLTLLLALSGLTLASLTLGASTAPAINSSSPAAAGLWEPSTAGCRTLSAEENTKLGMIRQMIDTNKPHAALAYLEAAKVNSPQADLLKADALRQTGRAAPASQIYQQLRGNCMAGYAHQGLGLLASEAGKTDEALAELKAASAALPVDPGVRNDYGYVLMMAGDYQAATHEFMTALELDPLNRRTANNLVLVLLRKGEHAKANEFASRLGIFPATLADLQTLARQPLSGKTQ